MNPVFCILTTINLLLPHPVYVEQKYTIPKSITVE